MVFSEINKPHMDKPENTRRIQVVGKPMLYIIWWGFQISIKKKDGSTPILFI
jgi:hypothetical protein